MKKIKKVLLVCSVYKPNIGGVETAINDLSRLYKKRGVETAVLTKRYPLYTSEYELVNGISVWRMQRPKTRSEFLNVIDWLKKNNKFLKADIVHIMGIRRPLPLFALLLSRLWGVPFIVTFSGGDLPESKDHESMGLWEEGKDTVLDAVMQADWITSFSSYTKKLAQDIIPLLNKVDVIYSGVNLSEIRKVKKAKVNYKYSFSARRLVTSKGIDILIKAFDEARKELPKNVKLLIAGTGPEEKNLKELVKSFNISKKVHFLGNVSHKNMCSYMKSAIAHICPSRAESGGTVNFESQASGCLPIGSDVGGIPEYIINGKTGYIFPSEDYNTLANLLVFSFKNANDRTRLTRNAKKYIKPFDIKSFAKKYIDGYNEVKKSTVKQFRPWSNLTAEMWEKINNK